MEVDGWVTSVQRLAFASSDLVYHREMCPPTAHCSRSGDHLLGLVSVVVCPGGCLVIVQQPAAPGAGPGVIPACSMQPASRPEASWPSALPARSIHVTPHRIARLECPYPRLVSSTSATLLLPLPAASLAWIGARLPGCEASPKHGDTREPAMAAGAWSMAHVVWTRGR